MTHAKPPSDQPDITPAVPGTLDQQLYDDLVTFDTFLNDRDRAMRGLYGVDLPRSLLRDTLVRAVLIEFGGDRVQHINFYKRGLSYLGGGAAVRHELTQLEALGIVILEPSGPGRRELGVIPTRKLVGWYQQAMPQLYEEIRQFLALQEQRPLEG